MITTATAISISSPRSATVPNRLFRNDRGKFVDVTSESGIGDTRRTVSAVWWDFDRDGDLDVFVANQEGDANGLFRQHLGRFEDVALASGVAGTPRPKEDGGVGPSLADFDLDGDFDVFVANYGPSALYRNEGGARFVDVAREGGIDLRGHGVTSAWGDIDNDGRPDLYVGNFIAGQPLYRDAFFINAATRFVEALPDGSSSETRRTASASWISIATAGSMSRSPTTIRPAAATRCGETPAPCAGVRCWWMWPTAMPGAPAPAPRCARIAPARGRCSLLS